MTPQFLRAEAARFREMAESVTDREASRQRLLNMALDYEARADAQDATSPPAPEAIPGAMIPGAIPGAVPEAAKGATPGASQEPTSDADPAAEGHAMPEFAVRPRLGRRTTLRSTRSSLTP